ncbi:hypothetical protein HMPREF9946_02284 [Acetobacteraceae bacterium AT-5844]|nr:hypothetical protein HMPREF9946_02284 [Acetobacteraceae bacterium AT-5844]
MRRTDRGSNRKKRALTTWEPRQRAQSSPARGLPRWRSGPIPQAAEAPEKGDKPPFPRLRHRRYTVWRSPMGSDGSKRRTTH